MERVMEIVKQEQGKPVTIEAVATIRNKGGELFVDWLIEGGLSAMVGGETLLICGERLTDSTGSGEVYTTPQTKQEQGEPVAEFRGTLIQSGRTLYLIEPKADLTRGMQFYTTPQQRTWVGLTDEDRRTVHNETFPHRSVMWYGADSYARAIEAKLKEKNANPIN
jgi:hypothetical protein